MSLLAVLYKIYLTKKNDFVAIHKNPQTNACCSLCKLEIATLAPSKFQVLIIDSSKLFSFYSTHPGGYVTLKTVALHGYVFVKNPVTVLFS